VFSFSCYSSGNIYDLNAYWCKYYLKLLPDAHLICIMLNHSVLKITILDLSDISQLTVMGMVLDGHLFSSIYIFMGHMIQILSPLLILVI
jgi:hypothetical protein